MMIEIKQLKNGILRVTDYGNEQPLLSRYRLYRNDFPEEEYGEKIRYSYENGRLTLDRLSCDIEIREEGFSLGFDLKEGERLFGLGDESRNSVMKRGSTATVWISNVTSYGPIPFVISSCGWAVMVNCTYKMTFDLGKAVKDKMLVNSEGGSLDFYIFLGASMRQTLSLYTDVSGKPTMMPKSAYGNVLINNEAMNAFKMLDVTNEMHKEGFPLDIMSLEPNWMETYYDRTTEKKWNRSMFDLPYWEKENFYGVDSFVYSLHSMGCLLSLWLCCEYDIFEEEERNAVEDKRYARHKAPTGNYTYKDEFTKQNESFFEHLKKFVDNGCSGFKLDGCNQIMEFPERLWAGKYDDKEVHNAYPILYARQLKEGFEGYTNRRLFMETCGAYAGIQKYSSTWAGDTGGGPDTLVSMLAYAMCGHTNTTADMYPSNKSVIHFGFLMPWTQHMSWAAYQYPMYFEESIKETYKYYDRLRNTLFPYIYSSARSSYETGFPYMRPLSLVYESNSSYDSIMNEYMLGDSLLVAAYDMNIRLPIENGWTDFFTGRVYNGGEEFEYIIPENRGGALFVKNGSILVMQEESVSLMTARPEKYDVHIYLGGDCDFTIYEDDGYSLGYEKGECCKTELSVRGDRLFISKRTGSFRDMPDAADLNIYVHDHGENRKPVFVSRYQYKDCGYEMSLLRPKAADFSEAPHGTYNDLNEMRK